MSGAQDHFTAFLALLSADATLNVYDGEVPENPAARYSLVYIFVLTPNGLVAPDAVALDGKSTAIDGRAYVHNVGATPASARIQSDRVRAVVLDKRPVIAGRDCEPVEHQESNPPQRNEELPGAPVHDLVDVYGWRSVPA